MSSRAYCVPRQIESSRKIHAGDVVATEITANFHEFRIG
jgi:hypothetical protein